MAFNKEQDEVIKTTKGILVVDAGPGTGKTYTITKRYMHILESEGASPRDILLLTFTRNAAENMKEKILNSMAGTRHAMDVLDVTVSTFHAFCNTILSVDPTYAPRHLGIAEPLSRGYKIVENEVLEHLFFNRVYEDFREERRNEYEKILCSIGNRQNEVRSIIAKLLSKGIFPKKEGWFLDGERHIDGDIDAFIAEADRLNEQKVGKSGSTVQSDLLKSFDLSSYDYHNLPPDIVSPAKQVEPRCIREAAMEDRTELKRFVHDIYYAYIRQSVIENHLSFDLMAMFAFLQLYHDHAMRASMAFPFVMIDEFQDTNEMQLHLALLLMKNPNLCVVGDWKQGIYGFRNATIDNILQFSEKYRHAVDTLNRGWKRIPFDAEPMLAGFVLNFRSSQMLLDFSPQALLTAANERDPLDPVAVDANILRLTATTDFGPNTGISFYRAETREDEAEMVLSIVQDIVEGDSYRVFENGEFRRPTYKDIAILARNRDFGLMLHERGQARGVPLRYDGGIELFNTDEGLLLLAWLRVLSNKSDKRGWITLLEMQGCTPPEKKALLREGAYPPELMALRRRLLGHTANIVELITAIYAAAGMRTAKSEAIIHTVRTLFDAYPLSSEQLIHYIEDNIENKETYTVDLVTAGDAATVQTIHGSKGLEYPIVIIADCNRGRFPSTQGDSSAIFLDDRAGLRCTKEYGRVGQYCDIFDNWRTRLIMAVREPSYDEERRLLYVALTRAKQYVVMTASRSPSQFFTSLCVEESVPPAPRAPVLPLTGRTSALPPLGEVPERGKAVLSPHDIMGPLVEDNGKGTAYGTRVHHMAERIAKGLAIDRKIEPAYGRIASFIGARRSARLCTELEFVLPLAGAMMRGTIDLLADYGDRFEIVDYKTDLGKQNLDRYIVQISAYYHAARGHLGYDGTCILYFVELDEPLEVEPLPLSELENAARSLGAL
jgi:superfamily I DNA/RNA helicase